MIWEAARGLLAVIFMALTGYCLVALVFRCSLGLLSRAEIVGYSFALGMTFVGAAMIVLSACHVPLSVPGILAAGCLPVALLVGFRARRCRSAARDATNGWRGARFASHARIPRTFLLLALAAALLFVFLGSVSEPMTEIDTVAAWGFNAKVYYCERTVFPAFLTHGLSGPLASHWRPLLPLAETWTYLSMGTWNDRIVKVLFFLTYAALLGILYGTLRRFLSPTLSLALPLVAATAPAIVVPFPSGSVASAMADVPFALFVAATVCLVTCWMAKQDRRYLILASLFAAATVWVKREGLPFAWTCVAVLWILEMLRRPRAVRSNVVSPLLFTLAPAISTVLVVLYSSRFPGPLAGELIQIDQAISTLSASRFVQLAVAIIFHAGDPTKWGLLWLLLALLIVLRPGHVRQRIIAFPLLVIVGHVAIALVYMAVTHAYSISHYVNLDMRRVLIQLAPAATVAVALLATADDSGSGTQGVHRTG